MELFIERSHFAKHMGIRIAEHGEGRAKAVMEIRDEHRNSFGTVHGAALFALADEAFAVACNSRGQVAMAIQISITYMKAAREGTLSAEAQEVSVDPKLGTYRIDVLDGDRNLVAVFQGLCYRKKETVEELLNKK
jgi:acyl-CoA thioesterase